MTWNTHIEKTAAKGNKKLGFLKRTLKINIPDTKSHVYKTLVTPTLEYCSTVWDPRTAKGAQKEMVQCQAARCVTNDYNYDPTEFSHQDAHRPQVTGPSPKANRCETLPDVQNSPQPRPDRCNKIC